MLKRTKIIATLGPASDSAATLKHMIQNGLDVVRINFSHGEHSEHAARIARVRDVARELDKQVAILADLQGPKIRIARFKNQKITLVVGAEFTLDANLDSHAGDEKSVGIDYKELTQDVKAGDRLLLNDGLIELTVKEVVGAKIICIVAIGGELSNNKGINKAGGGLSAKALTEKDKIDLKKAIELGADFLAISFPRDAADINEAKELVAKCNGEAGIIAKIERTEAIHNLLEIIDAADGVMVARGDLGVEIGDAELPAVQKRIIHEARQKNKPVITATQMMESMITNPIPTRAEVFDVANAVLDGTDAVMLSAETAVGKNPENVIAYMARICIGAEKTRIAQISHHRMNSHFESVDMAIAMATMYCANHSEVKGIVALTESGSTPLWMSRIRSGIPIYGLSRHEKTLRKMCLYRGVYPVFFDLSRLPQEQVNSEAVKQLEQSGIVQKGDWVLITRGDLLGVHGRTNSLKIVEVGNVY